MSGFSLWLSPSNNSPLESYLSTLSTRLKTVKFSPHVTLLSDKIVPALEISEVLEKIQVGVNTWKEANKGKEEDLIQFKDVRQGDLYYQCVLVALIETIGLFSLHESLLTTFGFIPPSPPTYFPHLSLIYGDLTREDKDRIIAEMISKGEVKGNEVVGITGFQPSEILLVRTKGPPSEWEILGRVSL